MLPLCFSAFVCFGLVLVLVGANQDLISADLQLDLTRSGLLGSALALGLGIGVVLAGPLFDRHHRRKLFVGSTLVAAVALLTVESGLSFSRLLLHVAAIGLGIGAYDTFINALVVERFRDRSARPMSLVHSGATLGAMAGPLLIATVGAEHHWTASFRWTGAAHLVLAAWAFFIPFPEPPDRPAELDAKPRGAGVRELLRSPALLLLAAVSFAYVGVEAGITIFAVPYADESLGLPVNRGRAMISAFWFGLLVGRVAVAALPGILGPRLLAFAGAAAFVCLITGVVTASPHAVALFAAVGLTLGCVFPLMISLAGREFANAPGTAAGFAAGAGAVGGLFIPWLTGWIGDQIGVAVAMGSLALWCLVIAVSAAAAVRYRRPPVG